MFSTAPFCFSLSSSAREEFPISTLPERRDSIPAEDPVNSAFTVTFGYFSMKASATAFASFSIEVLPAMVMLPLKSAEASLAACVSLALSAVLSAAWLPASVCAAFVSAFVSVVVPDCPHAARLAAVTAQIPAKAVNFLRFFIIIISSPDLLCRFRFIFTSFSFGICQFLIFLFFVNNLKITQNQPTKSMGWLILGYVFVKKICNCKEIVKLIGIRSLRFFHPYSLR